MLQRELPRFLRIAVPLAATILAMPVIALLTAILLLWLIHLWNMPYWLTCIVGAVLVIGGSAVVWWSMWRLARRRFQYSLRSLLIATTVFALILGLLCTGLQRITRQQRALIHIADSGGFLRYYIKPDNWLQRYNVDPFQKVVFFEIRSDSAVAAILDSADEFPDLASVGIWPGVSDAGLKRARDFDRFPGIDGFSLVDAQITDAGMDFLSQCTRLRHLSINGAGQITDEGLEHFADLPKLDDLWLMSARGKETLHITDAGLEHVGRMTKLKHLVLWNLPITDAGLTHLQNLHNLERLSVNGFTITEQGLVALGRSLPDCLIRRNDKLIAEQVKRIDVYELQPREGLIHSITDPDQIAKIVALAECYNSNTGWGPIKDNAIHAQIRLDFFGRTRRFYQKRLENRRIYGEDGSSNEVTDQQEQELLRLLDIKTTKQAPQPSPQPSPEGRGKAS
jgi:hypothetical protein